MKTSKSKIVESFYNNPEIKYLGSSGVFKSPSNFKAKSFSKTLISLLVDKKPVNRENIETKLGKINSSNNSSDNEEGVNNMFDSQTGEYIQNLWQESQGDITKFRLQLEGWFDRTMEHTIEWYKRKIRVVTFIIGFCIAWFFNADTFVIVHNLSIDKAAREEMVSMANAYIQNNPNLNILTNLDSIKGKDNYQEKLDSLLVINDQLKTDIMKANNILGLGCWPPDKISIHNTKNSIVKVYIPQIDIKSLTKDQKSKKTSITFSFWDKVWYMIRLVYFHFFGFFITAIAISLGAPFWFDLLNKLMQLRTSKKEETGTEKSTSTDQPGSPLDRVG